MSQLDDTVYDGDPYGTYNKDFGDAVVAAVQCELAELGTAQQITHGSPPHCFLHAFTRRFFDRRKEPEEVAHILAAGGGINSLGRHNVLTLELEGLMQTWCDTKLAEMFRDSCKQ